MRLVFSSLLFTALLATGTAQAAPAATSDIRESGFVYCVNGQVNTFNPQKASSGLIVATLAAQLYSRLLDVDPYTYRLVPELAESWEVLDNGATYRFRLRSGVNFQHTAWFTPTRTLNADDVVFTFQRIFDRHHPWHNVNGDSFPYFDSLQFADSVESVRKLDSRTVEFRLKKPDASFLWHLATHYASVMSAEYAAQLQKTDHQELIDRQPVGTGPFQLDEYRAGQYVRLQRHEKFWLGKPLMQQVVVDLGSGGTGRLSKLLTGECRGAPHHGAFGHANRCSQALPRLHPTRDWHQSDCAQRATLHVTVHRPSCARWWFCRWCRQQESHRVGVEC